MINAIGIIGSDSVKITQRAAATLQANYLYGVETYAFSFKEIASYLKIGYINAFQWKDGEFITVQTDLPKYIDIPFSVSQIKQNYPEEYNWLRANAVLLDEQSIDKYHLQKEMLATDLAPYAILTFPFNTFDSLNKLTDLIPKGIIKPSGGRKGIGLMTLDKKEDGLHYKTKTTSGLLTADFLDKYVKEIDHGTLLFEPRLNILNNAGNAVDFRCIVAKNGQNQWENVLTYARIGGSEVASNFSDGGSLNYAEEVLEQLVPGQGNDKKAEIDGLALRVADLIENWSTTHICRLGIDICLDRDTNRIYVIEANSKPGTKFIGPWPLQLVMARYFKFVLENNIFD